MIRTFIIGFLVSFVFQFPVRGNVTFRRVRAYRVRTILERVESNLRIDSSTIDRIKMAAEATSSGLAPAFVVTVDDSLLKNGRRIKLPEAAIPESSLLGLLQWLDILEKGHRLSVLSDEIYYHDKAVVLRGLVELGQSYPQIFVSRIESLCTEYNSQDMAYVLGKIDREVVNHKLREILLDEEISPQLRERAALALSYKTDSESISALRQALGPERSSFYDEFGLWVIDIGVEEEYKFTPQALEEIRTALKKIPPRHLEEGVRVILKRLPQAPREVFLVNGERYPEWMEDEFSEVWRAVPAGSYESFHKIVYVNELEDVARIIFHEVGHGVHSYIVSQEDWRRFKEFHDNSTSLKEDFAYPYGSVNCNEDFATIYELLLFAPEDILTRADGESEVLRQKVGLVRKYLQGP